MLNDADSNMIAQTIAHQANLTGEVLRQELTRPATIMKPRLFIDGNQWCALYGENLQSGVAGFGPCPFDALLAFDSAIYTHLNN